MNKFVYLIPLLPLLGFLVNGLGRNHLSKGKSAWVGSLSILLSFIFSFFMFSYVRQHGAFTQHYFTFFSADFLRVPFAFQVDSLSSVFLLVVTGVGFLIHLYSIGYMHEENPVQFARYFSFLNLFVFSMLILVLGAGYIIMFIGWEGVGLCSYLLIGFWFKNPEFNYAAKKAFIMNRIGDLGFLLGIFWMISKIGSSDFSVVFSARSVLSQTDVTAITLLLFIGATGKSAQIPLYTWLPDAMAGPTPVSALIHAATMVTAGIYMIARSHLLYSMSPFTMEIIAIIGIATALLSGAIAMKQTDIKKVLAYSTVSQLGYMFLGLGVGAYGGSVFHVVTHSFFKALLFLCAGSVMHALSGQQDIRKMGGLAKKMPITHLSFLLASLSIAGVFPFSGFFSKDGILSSAYAVSPVFWFLGIIGVVMTAFYMFRLYSLVFLGHFRGSVSEFDEVHEGGWEMTVPLIILMLLSVFGGVIGVPQSLGGSDYIGSYLASSIGMPVQNDHPALEILLMAVSFGITLICLLFTLFYFKKHQELSDARGISLVLYRKVYVDEFYNTVFVKPLNKLGDFLKTWIDLKFIDGFVEGVGCAIAYCSKKVKLLQSGLVDNYILLMVVSMLILIMVWVNDGFILHLLNKLF